MKKESKSKPQSIDESEIEAWQAWEDYQKTNPHAVNPYAFVCGYKIAKRRYNSLLDAAFVAGRSKTTWEQFKKDHNI